MAFSPSYGEETLHGQIAATGAGQSMGGCGSAVEVPEQWWVYCHVSLCSARKEGNGFPRFSWMMLVAQCKEVPCRGGTSCLRTLLP